MTFKVIYADPPWNFAAWSHRGEGKGASQHYDCMKLSDICTLQVDGRIVHEIADDDAALFLWVVQPMLPEALQVMQAWGFSFRTVAFYWVKMAQNWTDDIQGSLLPARLSPRVGLGYHTRSGAEQCWLGIRGNGYTRINQDVEQVLHAPLREHSRKPDEIAERIVRLVGDVPRIELFARKSRPGWYVWGDQAPERKAS
jgi:N6-adenosine-specific RNA methylase IME4